MKWQSNVWIHNPDQPDTANRDNATLDPTDEPLLPSQQRRRSPRLAERPTSPINPPNTINIIATEATAVIETEPRLEAPLLPPTRRPIAQQRRPSPRRTETTFLATIPQATAEEEDAGETVTVAGTAASHRSLLDRQPRARPGRPRVDPTISPQEQTRLRQQLARVQPIVQQDEALQELPPIVEFSALAIRDGPVVSAPESGPEPGFEGVSLHHPQLVPFVALESLRPTLAFQRPGRQP